MEVRSRALDGSERVAQRRARAHLSTSAPHTVGARFSDGSADSKYEHAHGNFGER